MATTKSSKTVAVYSVSVILIILALICTARFVPSGFVEKIKTAPETEQRIIPLG